MNRTFLTVTLGVLMTASSGIVFASDGCIQDKPIKGIYASTPIDRANEVSANDRVPLTSSPFHPAPIDVVPKTPDYKDLSPETLNPKSTTIVAMASSISE